MEQINDICAGFLFTGGQDVDPHLYGEEPDALCGRINHARDELEKRIFDMAWEKDKAVFGICRGLQDVYKRQHGKLRALSVVL